MPSASTDATRASDPLITRTCWSNVPSSMSPPAPSAPATPPPPIATEAPRVRARNRRVLVMAGGVVVGLAALFVLASLVEHIWYSGAVLPGVRIDGAHIGGKKDADARAAIARLSAHLDATPIR